MNLEGAVAVVTGGGSGLGAALVRCLADAGAVPVILDVKAARVEQVLEEIRGEQPSAAGWTCDVGERDQVADTFAAINGRFGRIDLLVNCAGTSMLRPFLEMTEADLDWIARPNHLGRGALHPCSRPEDAARQPHRERDLRIRARCHAGRGVLFGDQDRRRLPE